MKLDRESYQDRQDDVQAHEAHPVLFKGLDDEHGRILGTAGVLDLLVERHHVFDDLDAAVAHARRHVQRSHPSGHEGRGAA